MVTIIVQAMDQTAVVPCKLWSPAAESPVLRNAVNRHTVLHIANVIANATTKTLTSAECG